MKTLLVPAIILAFIQLDAQLPVGQWREHLPYKQGIDVCTDGELIYCATPHAVFYFDPSDFSINRISKANLLSDVGVTAIEFDSLTATLVVGYENGNVDLIANGNAYNLSDIKRSNLVADKKIYHILPYNQKVYLATGFGVVVLDIAKKEISSTWFIGESGELLRVNDLDIKDGIIYASTSGGLRSADINNPFLANYEVWNWENDIPQSPLEVLDYEYFAGTVFLNAVAEGEQRLWYKNQTNNTWEIFDADTLYPVNDLYTDDSELYVSKSNSIRSYNTDFNAVIDHNWHLGIRVFSKAIIKDAAGALWFADKNAGLCKYKPGLSEKTYAPDGPASINVRRLDVFNDNLWIATGGTDASWTNLWNDVDISAKVGDQWVVVDNGPGVNSVDGVRDFMHVAIDPLDNNHIFFGSWEEGLVEIKNKEIVEVYNEQSGNSTIEQSNFSWFEDWCGVAGLAFDLDGNLWCTNSWTESVLHVRTAEGEFQSFDFSPAIIPTDKIGDVLPSQQGYIWTVVSGKGLLVLNTNGTLTSPSDDNYKLLNDTEGNGGLPTSDILCVEEDLEGEIWVGTAQGLAIFYSPECIFGDESCDAEQILIEQDGNIQVLLETEAISALEIDGGNRKWVGTQNSGAYLFSPDGLETIYHFTADNSPLFSNNILDIGINQANGEVFFATEKGIVSYFSGATNFDSEMSAVQVFPNPVLPDFSGVITIDGLDYQTDIKITDISGQLVYATTSEGGRAIWNGSDFNGQRAVNGIYLVFAAKDDSDASEIARIALLR